MRGHRDIDSDPFKLEAFDLYFPEMAETETHTFWTAGRSQAHQSPYHLIEFYCMDPLCDCERVMLGVIDPDKPEKTLLSVSYGFNQDEPQSGPYIDAMNPATPEGESLFPEIKRLLDQDRGYISRLKSHYRLMKARVNLANRVFLH